MAIDKKLKYKDIKGQKHMLAYITPGEAKQLEKLGGQKIMTKEGIPAYPPDNDAPGQSTGTSTSGTTSGGEGRPNMADIAGPVTGPPDMSHFGDTGDIVQADLTPYNQRPDTITSFMDNYKAQARSMGLKNAIPGAQIYNVGKTAFETAKAREMLGLAPAVGPGPIDDGGNGGDGGIMNLYQPNMLDISGEVEAIDIGDGEMEEFIQRFKVKDDFRQAKGPERLIQDQAIAKMISRLYT